MGGVTTTGTLVSIGYLGIAVIFRVAQRQYYEFESGPCGMQGGVGGTVCVKAQDSVEKWFARRSGIFFQMAVFAVRH